MSELDDITAASTKESRNYKNIASDVELNDTCKCGKEFPGPTHECGDQLQHVISDEEFHALNNPTRGIVCTETFCAMFCKHYATSKHKDEEIANLRAVIKGLQK